MKAICEICNQELTITKQENHLLKEHGALDKSLMKLDIK